MKISDVRSVYYINLAERHDRREHISNMLSTYDGKISRIEAIRHFDSPESLGLRMKEGYIGHKGVASIFQSHRKALNSALQDVTDFPICILEDDVHFSGDIWNFEIADAALPKYWEIVALNPRFRKRHPPASSGMKKVWEMPLREGCPQFLTDHRKNYIITGAHFLIYRDRDVVQKIVAEMASAEIWDVDGYLFNNFKTVGVLAPSVRTGGFTSDHNVD